MIKIDLYIYILSIVTSWVDLRNLVEWNRNDKLSKL